MKQIETKPLTLENFKKYGSFSDMIHPAGAGGGIPGMTFYPDLEVLELGQTHMAAFSVTSVKKALGTRAAERAFCRSTAICSSILRLRA